MSVFLNDTFDEASSTAITSHTPNTGGAYSYLTGISGGTGGTVGAGTGTLVMDSTVSLAGNAATPGSADYTLTGNLRLNSGSPRVDAMLRQSGTNGYFVLVAIGSITIYKVTGGAFTSLNSGSGAVSGLTDYAFSFGISGSTITCTVNTLTVTATDSTYTAAGKAAIGGRDATIYDITATDSTSSSVVSGNFDLADFTLSGTFATGALSQLAGGVTMDDFVLSGFLGLAPGRVDTAPFKNWSGTLLPGTTIPNVVFLRLDRTKPLDLANQVTAGDGVMTITNAALTPGTYYIMVSYDATGANVGAELVLAA